MSGNLIFGVAATGVFALLIVIWLGPHLLLRLVNWWINRINKKIREFQERQEARHEEMRAALRALEQYMEDRK